MNSIKIDMLLERGQVEDAKNILEKIYKEQDYQDWLAEQREEYLKLFPKYREMTDEEESEYDLENFDGTHIKPDNFKYPQVQIDYSDNSDYVSFDIWLNETKVVKEAVVENDVIIEPEVTELIRKYEPKDVTERVEEYINNSEAYKKYLKTLKEKAKEELIVSKSNIYFQADLTSISYMDATLTLANYKFNKALIEFLKFIAKDNDEALEYINKISTIYGTKISWKNAHNNISNTQVDTLAGALEKALIETSKIIGVENE